MPPAASLSFVPDAEASRTDPNRLIVPLVPYADWPQLKKKRNAVVQGVNHAKVEVKEEDTLMLGDGPECPKSPGAAGSEEPTSPMPTSPVAASSKPSRGKGKGKGKKGGRGGRAPKEQMPREDLGDLLPFAPGAIPRGGFELPYDIWWQNHLNGSHISRSNL